MPDDFDGTAAAFAGEMKYSNSIPGTPPDEYDPFVCPTGPHEEKGTPVTGWTIDAA